MYRERFRPIPPSAQFHTKKLPVESTDSCRQTVKVNLTWHVHIALPIVNMAASLGLRERVCVRMYTFVCLYVRIYTCVCVNVYLYVCMFVCLYVHIYTCLCV